MDKRTKCSLVVFGVFLWLLSSPGVNLAVPRVAAQSPEQGQSRGWAEVDCDNEHRGALQRAIDRAGPGDTILVRGTCYENVTEPYRDHGRAVNVS